jgi:cullin-associated NEDD8-dissociated protein 1
MGVQVDAEGNAAIIHTVGSLTVKERVAIDTGTYFGVLWEDGLYPTPGTNCSSECTVHGNTCVCHDITVHTSAVFSQLPTLQEVEERLLLGATDPALFDDGTYYRCTAPLCSIQSYRVYFSTPVVNDVDIVGAFDADTVFELTTTTGSSSFFSNIKSTVVIGSGAYSFRNPPMFNSPVDPTQRDGLYETDAVLHHHVNHPNTAPFIAKKLINLLISSNPSPRYVKAAADAFSDGVYTADGHSFGSGVYGVSCLVCFFFRRNSLLKIHYSFISITIQDMEALIAAIMLDREARSTTLDDDSNHGRAREPLLEILHMSRAMKLSTESGVAREIDMIYMKNRGLGQESFNAPSVFSFFLNEYQPVGPVLGRGLVAPETQLFDAPKLISYVNGLFSLTQFGLTDCDSWTGFGDDKSKYFIPDYPDGGQFGCDAAKANNPGVPLRFRYTPPSWGGATNVNKAPTSEVIDDIDLLLTGGKISAANKAILENIYDIARANSGSDGYALRAVIQHYSVAPEFHITNNLQSSKATAPDARPVPDITIPPNPEPVTEYKAIVYMFLSGAMDSYNALVPLNCYLHNQYLQVRSNVAVTSGLLQIDASGSNQPCNSFGLHPSLVNIHKLYKAGDAAFFANIGVSESKCIVLISIT